MKELIKAKVEIDHRKCDTSYVDPRHNKNCNEKDKNNMYYAVLPHSYLLEEHENLIELENDFYKNINIANEVDIDKPNILKQMQDIQKNQPVNTYITIEPVCSDDTISQEKFIEIFNDFWNKFKALLTKINTRNDAYIMPISVTLCFSSINPHAEIRTAFVCKDEQNNTYIDEKECLSRLNISEICKADELYVQEETDKTKNNPCTNFKVYIRALFIVLCLNHKVLIEPDKNDKLITSQYLCKAPLKRNIKIFNDELNLLKQSNLIKILESNSQKPTKTSDKISSLHFSDVLKQSGPTKTPEPSKLPDPKVSPEKPKTSNQEQKRAPIKPAKKEENTPIISDVNILREIIKIIDSEKITSYNELVRYIITNEKTEKYIQYILYHYRDVLIGMLNNNRPKISIT